MASDNKALAGETQANAIKDISGHMHACLELQKIQRSRSIGDNLLQCGRSGGIYLTIVYLFTKVLFIVNLILQFVILNEFLGTSYTFWGASILTDILRNHDWQVSGHFPRVTVCDFEVRKLGNIHRYTVQCVLMINMFSEKIFLFIWWWFLVVTIVTILNFFYWAFVLLSSQSRRSYIQKMLYGHRREGEEQVTATQAARFADYIGPDVVLALRLMANNAGELMSVRACKGLYDRKCERDAEAKKVIAKKNDVPGDYPVRPTKLEKERPVASLTNV